MKAYEQWTNEASVPPYLGYIFKGGPTPWRVNYPEKVHIHIIYPDQKIILDLQNRLVFNIVDAVILGACTVQKTLNKGYRQFLDGKTSQCEISIEIWNSISRSCRNIYTHIWIQYYIFTTTDYKYLGLIMWPLKKYTTMEIITMN